MSPAGCGLKWVFAQIPGGIIEDSCVLRGVMINKDVTHARMRRHIRNPRIVLLDSSLEYKKGESQVRARPPALTCEAAPGVCLLPHVSALSVTDLDVRAPILTSTF